MPGSTCCQGEGCSDLAACTAGRAAVFTCTAVLSLLGLALHTYCEKQLATSCFGRLWQGVRFLVPVLLTWLLAFISSLLALQQTQRPPGELQYVSAASATWAALLVLFLQVLWGLWVALRRGGRTESLLQQHGETRKIAVIINIQAGKFFFFSCRFRFRVDLWFSQEPKVFQKRCLSPRVSGCRPTFTSPKW